MTSRRVAGWSLTYWMKCFLELDDVETRGGLVAHILDEVLRILDPLTWWQQGMQYVVCVRLGLHWRQLHLAVELGLERVWLGLAFARRGVCRGRAELKWRVVLHQRLTGPSLWDRHGSAFKEGGRAVQGGAPLGNSGAL